jgi:two-component system NtrC family sensor kinase
VSIEEVIDGSLDLLAYGLNSAGIEARKDLPADLPEALADPDQLMQVFNNLIINAKQAMLGCPGERRLIIAAKHDAEAGEVVVTVADNGPGIPAEIRSRIFDPFFTTKPAGVGTGIGLAVCRGIVEGLGGRIEVEAAKTGATGAVFRIALPMAEEAAPAVAEGASEEATAPPVRVLVADDEAEIGEMLRDLLIGDGHHVDVVGNGREALRRLAAEDYDVVISDLIMPDIDGPALYRKLKRHRPELVERLIFITGDSLSPTVKRFLGQVRRPVLEKPFAPAEVRRAVRQAAA